MNNELWDAICALHHLLLTRETKEADFQEFFERNPVVFSTLGFPVFASYEKSSGNKLPYDEENNTQREPDFICGNPTTQQVTVFELKTPVDKAAITSRKDGQRAKFMAVLEGYFSQTTEYINFIAANLSARQAVAETLNLKGVKVVNGILVYGLTSDEEAPIVAKLAAGRSPQIEVLHFDQIYLNLVEEFSSGRPDNLISDASGKTTHLSGITFVLHAVISKHQENKKAYIFDLGNLIRNRISFYVLNGRGTVELLDSEGRPHYYDFEVKFNDTIHLRLELSNESKIGFVSVSIDNREVVLMQSSQGFDVTPDLGSFVLGADLLGKQGGRFRMLENYITSRTMSYEERMGSYKYYVGKVVSQERCIEFNGKTFMRRDSEGGLAQEDNDKRPKYRESIYYSETE